MTVSNLDDRRAARDADQAADAACCSRCGCQWFRLHGPEGQPPAVTLNGEGRLTAYAGHLVCNDCGSARM